MINFYKKRRQESYTFRTKNFINSPKKIKHDDIIKKELYLFDSGDYLKLTVDILKHVTHVILA